MPVEVLAGRDGWLFMRGDSNRVLDQHLGAFPVEPELRSRWERLLSGRTARLAAAGVPWLGHVAPDKEAVYPEMLPEGLEPGAQRPIHEFLLVAERAGAPVSYGLEPQLQAKPGGPLYHRADTHWNARGAWVASRALCAELDSRWGIEATPPAAEEIRWRRVELGGDLGSKLMPPVTAETIVGRPVEQRSRLVSDNRIRNHGRLVRFRRPDRSAPSALVFGESFAYPMLPFLKEAFSRLTFAHSSWIDERLIRAERPDAVIWLPVERFLIDPPESDRGAARRLAAMRALKRVRRRTAGPPGAAGSHFLRDVPRG